VPARAGDGGGTGEGGEPKDEQSAEPEELICLVEERRTLRLRRGIAPVVGSLPPGGRAHGRGPLSRARIGLL
jgi:hypothetical protein